MIHLEMSIFESPMQKRSSSEYIANIMILQLGVAFLDVNNKFSQFILLALYKVGRTDSF